MGFVGTLFSIYIKNRTDILKIILEFSFVMCNCGWKIKAVLKTPWENVFAETIVNLR